jgi:hypothetical protein
MIDLVPRGYTPGSGMLSPDGSMFYLNIPKNASSFTSQIFESIDWQHTSLHDSHAHTNIVVLRDPVERWVSGIATYISSWVLGFGYGSDHFVADYNEATERLIFDNLKFDDHTETQTRFVNQLIDRGQHTVYLFLEKDKNTLIHHISTLVGQSLNTDALFDNDAELNYDTAHLTRFFKQRLLEKPELVEKIKECYNDDIKLIERVIFYGKS